MAQLQLAAFDYSPSLSSKDFSGSATCVAFADNNVYVGTSKGKVCMYRVQPQDDQKDSGQDTFYTMGKGLGKDAPVTQLEVNHSLGLLIVLCGGTMGVHSLKTLARQKDKLSADNIAHFCSDVKSPNRLLLAHKKEKKLTLLDYSHSKSQYVMFNELGVPARPLAMAWYNNYMCLGFKEQYSILTTAGKPIDIDVPLQSGTKPCVQVIDSESFLLVSSLRSSSRSRKSDATPSSVLGIPLRFTGDPAPKAPVQWPQPPLAMCVCGDYLVSLLPNGTVDITSLLESKKVQTIDFKGGHQLYSPPIKIQQQGKEFQKVLLCSPEAVGTLRLTPVEKQIKQYLDQGFVEEAQSLLMTTDPSAEEKERFHEQAGFQLISRLFFHRAFEHFAQSKIDAREIMELYPELKEKLPPYQRTSTFQPHTTELYRKTNTLVERVMQIEEIINVGLNTKRNSESKQEQVIGSMAAHDLMRAARVEFARYLWTHRTQVQNLDLLAAVDTAMLVLLVDLQGKTYSRQSKSAKVLGDVPQVTDDPSVCSSTTLSFTAKQLLLPENSCLLDTCVQFLHERRQYTFVAWLYKSKGQLRKALETWQKLGDGKVEQALPPGTYDTYGFDGVADTVDLLRTLPDGDLLWEFVGWVLEKEPGEGMKAFTDGARDPPLAHERVVQYLTRKFADGVKPSPSEPAVDLIEKYLEHIVFALQEQDAKFHNQLALRYFKKVNILHKSLVDGASAEKLSKLREVPAGSEPGMLGPARKKLLQLLRESNEYHVEDMLEMMSTTALYDELIILNSKLHRHDAVLDVFINKLGDHVRAAEYCLSAKPVDDEDSPTSSGGSSSVSSSYAASSSSSSSGPTVTTRYRQDAFRSRLFASLLRLYFAETPGDEHKTYSGDVADVSDRWKKGLEVLNTYAVHINPVEALKVIPPQIPLASVGRYLQRVIPHTLHTHRDTQVVKGLSKIDNFQVQAKLMKVKSRSVTIFENTKCPVCGKLLQNKMIQLHPAPNAEPVHYGCIKMYRPPTAPRRPKAARVPHYA